MKYICQNGHWVPAHFFAKPPRVFPAIIRDTMEPVRSMASGAMHDSKSALRAEYRERGYEELGNDVPMHNTYQEPDDRLLEQRIAESWEKLEQGYQPEPPMVMPADTRIINDV